MTTYTSLSQADVRHYFRRVERPAFTEAYLTVIPRAELPLEAAAELMMARAAEITAEEGVQTIQEKIYGLRTAKTIALDARRTAYRRRGLDASFTPTFVEGRPAAGGALAGIQLWGVIPTDPGQQLVWTVHQDAHRLGRLWTGDGFRMLHLPLICGEKANGTLASCAPGQAENMFANAHAALDRNGFAYSQVVRTWIYLSRILDWYGEFNRVRTAHHQRVGLRHDERGPIFPASTGIQGRHGNEECFMDLLALECLDPQRVSVVPVRHTSRQGSAFSYGSAFSRGMVVEIDGRKIVFVSGTASVDAAGKSTHWNDWESQATETLLNVAAVLEDQGGSLDDISMATVFCKEQQALDAFQLVTGLLRVPPFPAVTVLADVCRDELLIEIEAVAVI